MVIVGPTLSCVLIKSCPVIFCMFYCVYTRVVLFKPFLFLFLLLEFSSLCQWNGSLFHFTLRIGWRNVCVIFGLSSSYYRNFATYFYWRFNLNVWDVLIECCIDLTKVCFRFSWKKVIQTSFSFGFILSSRSPSTSVYLCFRSSLLFLVFLTSYLFSVYVSLCVYIYTWNYYINI